MPANSAAEADAVRSLVRPLRDLVRAGYHVSAAGSRATAQLSFHPLGAQSDMHDAHATVLAEIRKELENGEVPIDAVAWHFHEEHSVTEPKSLLSVSLAVIREVLSDPNIAIVQLEGGFKPWLERGEAAFHRLTAARTIPNETKYVPSFGWSAPPQLFFLLTSHRETVAERHEAT